MCGFFRAKRKSREGEGVRVRRKIKGGGREGGVGGGGGRVGGG